MCACSDAQLCLTFCDSVDCSPPDSSVHGIFQAIRECVAISYSRRPSRPRDQTWVFCISCIDRRILDHYAIWEAPHRRVLSPKTHNPSLTRGKKQRNPNQGTVFLLSEQYSSELSRSSKRREVWDTVRLESSKETWVLMRCGVLDGSWDRKWASMDKLVKSE